MNRVSYQVYIYHECHLTNNLKITFRTTYQSSMSTSNTTSASQQAPKRGVLSVSRKFIAVGDGETLLGVLQRVTSAGQRLDAIDLVRQIFADGNISTAEGQEVVRKQGRLAIGDKAWIREARWSALTLYSADWVDNNLPLAGRSMKQVLKGKQKKVSTSTRESGMCKDFRLESDPDLPVVRVNVADETPLESLVFASAVAPRTETLPASAVAPGSASPSPMEVDEGKSSADEDVMSDDSAEGSDEPLVEGPRPHEASGEGSACDPSDDSLLAPGEEDILDLLVPGEEEELLGVKENLPVNPRGDSDNIDEANREESNVKEPACQAARPVLQPLKDNGSQSTRHEKSAKATHPVIKSQVFKNRTLKRSSGDGSHTDGPEDNKRFRMDFRVSVAEDSEHRHERRIIQLPENAIPRGMLVSERQCPVTECTFHSKRLMKHVHSEHLPKLFSNQLDGCEDEAVLFRKRLQALRNLIRRSLGAAADFEAAVRKINASGKMPTECQANCTVGGAMLDLWTKYVAKCPSVLTLSPLVSPALLFHWRCLIILWGYMSRDGQDSWTRECDDLLSASCPAVEVNQKGAAAVRNDEVHPKGKKAVGGKGPVKSKAAGKTVSGSARGLAAQSPPKSVSAVVPVGPCRGFDSHFHLDRTSYKLWGKSTGFMVEDLLRFSSSGGVQPRYPVVITGGVVNYSEPFTYPRTFCRDEKWKYAIGVHPKHIGELTDEKFRQLSSLLGSSRVVALGEVGLDRTVYPNQWQAQRAVLRRVLTLLRPDRVLVLHLHGVKQDPYAYDVSMDCILILLEASCPRMQPIHLHCFGGNREVVGRWQRHFPNAHFGFTDAVAKFDNQQKEALRSIPKERLLVETDSPYMRPNGGGTNTPAFLGDVANDIAPYVDLSVRQ